MIIRGSRIFAVHILLPYFWADGLVHKPLRFTRHNILSTSLPIGCKRFMAKPKSGSIVESYQTVAVNCCKCQTRLFRYKKKNGTKSNLVKCYLERISEDSAGILEQQTGKEEQEWACPLCQTEFARSALIHGRPALKLIGGKVRMTKK